MSEKKGMSKAHQRQAAKHDRTKKYEKQKERGFETKLKNALYNAARHDESLVATFLTEQGGWKKVLFLAQNTLNRQGLIDSLASRAGKAKHGHSPKTV